MATGKSLDEYIKDQETDYQKKSEKIEKRKVRFKIKSIIFGSIFLGLLIYVFSSDSFGKDSNYEALKDVSITDTENIEKIAASLELLEHSDMYEKYEMAYLGNKGFHSLNYGLLAENQYGYTTINENNEIILNIKGKENIIATEQISQINITSNKVIYRGTDKKLYISNHDGSEKAAIVYDKVGTALLVGDDVYYVNYSKTNDLYKYNLKDKKSTLVLEADIKTFTIVADTILYVDYNNYLYSTSLEGVSRWSLANVDKFYFNGRIFVQNNDKIFSFNLNKHFPEDVISGITELLGADTENIYYSIKNKVYAYNLRTDKKIELPYKYNYFKGVYKINEKNIALGGEISEN